MTVNRGTDFEGYVQLVYDTLVNQRGRSTVVGRRVDVTDTRGNRYNIDVYYEFAHAGITHRVAIECKDTQRPVERDDVLAFAKKVEELPGTTGVFVSRNGFQRSALAFLDQHGIKHLTGAELPRFGELIAEKMISTALPDEHAIGEPFWALMQVDGHGQNTGRHAPVGHPDAPRSVRLIPLFLSRAQAQSWERQSRTAGRPQHAARGLGPAALEFLLTQIEEDGNVQLLIVAEPGPGRVEWYSRLYTPRQLAAEYCRSEPAWHDHEPPAHRLPRQETPGSA